MSDETEAGSAGAPSGRRHSRGGSGQQSPLQARAAFIKNRSWESVVGFNRGACERGGAQHGESSESYRAVESSWRTAQTQILTFGETLDFLKSCHREAPFLFFNGNTFAAVARGISDIVFAELPPIRRRELVSAVAHYVSGVLDRESMAALVLELWESGSLLPGDLVKTLKGSQRGVIVRILDDGRVKWRTSSGTELIALPESLLKDDASRG